MHCTSLSTKCLNNGLKFLPNPEGHGFVLWIFSQTLWVLRFLGFENCVACQDQLRHHRFCPVLFLTMPMSMQLQKGNQIQEHGRNGVKEEDVGFSLFLFFFSVSSFFSSTFRLLFPSFISSLFCYLFFPLPSFFSFFLKWNNG